MDDQPSNPADVPQSPGWTWWVSPYDEHLHCFETLGEPAEAMCTHTVPPALLQPNDEERPPPRCMACLLTAGDVLTRGVGDRDRYQQ